MTSGDGGNVRLSCNNDALETISVMIGWA